MSVDDVGGDSGRPCSAVVGTDARIIAMNSYVNVDVTLKARPSPPATAPRPHCMLIAYRGTRAHSRS